MANMAFNVKQVREYLLNYGTVATVRGYHYQTDIAMVQEVDLRVKRELIFEIFSEQDLTDFVEISGFKTASEWWKQIKHFCNGRMWLYRVTVLEGQLTAEREREEQEHKREYQQSLIDDVMTTQERLYREGERNRTYDQFDDGVATPIEEYDLNPHQVHDLDVRRVPELRDPALVDLQPFRDAARLERIEREQARIAKKREILRDRYADAMSVVPTCDAHDPEKIMRMSAAEEQLALLACQTTTEELEWCAKVALEIIETHIDDLTHEIRLAQDTDVKLLLLDEIEEAREQRQQGEEYLSGLCAA